jgi:hypothetical protein
MENPTENDNSSIVTEGTVNPTASETQHTEYEKQLYARLKKEEERRKSEEDKRKSLEAEYEKIKQLNSTPQTPPISREEVQLEIMASQGYTKESLEVLKGISKGFNLPLTEAVNHEIFKAYKVQEEARKVSEQAQLRSQGSAGSEAPLVDAFELIKKGDSSAIRKELERRESEFRNK